MKVQGKRCHAGLSSHQRLGSRRRPRRLSTRLVRFCETCDVAVWAVREASVRPAGDRGALLDSAVSDARHERLDLQPHLQDGKYRPGDDYAERTLKTAYGEVTYGRHYLMPRGGGSGFFRSTWSWV